MVRGIPIRVGDNFCSLPLGMGLLISVSFILSLCARHARKVPRKCSSHKSGTKIAPKSLLPSSKMVVGNSNSDNVDRLTNHRKSGDDSEAETVSITEEEEEEGFGEGGLWQKAILMGEKCQPPEFSGVLFYDSNGNRIAELPRSPRAMPLRNFSSFPAAQDAQC